MLSFKPAFSLSSFTLRRLFSFSSLSGIRMVSSAYLRLLTFLLANLIPTCDSSKLASHMMYPAHENESERCSAVSDSVTPWNVACQAPLSMELSRQEYWRGLPFPSPEDLHDPRIEPGSPALQADSLPFEPATLKLNKPGDNTALTYSFPNFEPVLCSMCSSTCCFLTCIQVSQETGIVVWYSYLFRNFPQFVVIHTKALV